MIRKRGYVIDELKTLPPEIQSTVIKALVLAIFVVSGVSGSGVFRVDKFGRTDFEYGIEIYDRRIKEWITVQQDKRQQECMLKIQQVSDDKPPNPTRKRIHAVERCAEKVCSDYEIPTLNWQD